MRDLLVSLRQRLTSGWHWLRPVLSQRHFWRTALFFVGGVAVFGLLVNFVVMPFYTRQGVQVEVPDVRTMALADAEALLRGRDLEPAMRAQPFNPNMDPDEVVDQDPKGGRVVKPGRTVYVYVNLTPSERVRVPDVLTLSEGRARVAIRAAGLQIEAVREDDTPSPYEGTIVRQQPSPGAEVLIGTGVTLYTSPGPGNRTVVVPDVVGLQPDEARRFLQDAGLFVDPNRSVAGTITSQRPEAGAAVPEGTEVRLSAVDDDG
ncbi:MAG: PASTA domain-containing protein [Bacteroidota bacterium]